MRRGETEAARSRGVTLSGGGRGRRRPRRAAVAAGGRERDGRGSGHHGVGLDSARRCGLVVRWASCRVQAVELTAVGVATLVAGERTPEAEIVARCAAQCAASNRPQAGCGDCALPLPSLLFRGATPGRSVDLTGGRFTHSCNATAVFAPTARGPRLARDHSAIRECVEGAANRRNRQRSLRRAPRPSVLQVHNYRQMNDLSKDAVNWLAVGDDGAGPAHRQLPRQDPQGRPQEPHLPDPAQRRGPA